MKGSPHSPNYWVFFFIKGHSNVLCRFCSMSFNLVHANYSSQLVDSHEMCNRLWNAKLARGQSFIHIHAITLWWRWCTQNCLIWLTYPNEEKKPSNFARFFFNELFIKVSKNFLAIWTEIRRRLISYNKNGSCKRC